MKINTPVVFIIYKRPTLTRKVWAEIRRAKPPVLLVVADGPRSEAETALCAECRAVVEQVDWTCDVRRNYAVSNMGCKQRVATGLNWAFEQVEEAIILEDDCVPDPSFFNYCEELLTYYRDDKRVMHIGGDNFLCRSDLNTKNYYFSKYVHVWGWATWKRAWKCFDLAMQGWPVFRASEQLKRICQDQTEFLLWQSILDDVFSGETNSWAYIWQYTCFINDGLAVVPAANLVSNIGTGTDATHRNDGAWYMNLPAASLPQIVHNAAVERNVLADAAVYNDVYRKQPYTWRRMIVRKVLSPWTYGHLLRSMPVIGPLWDRWRSSLRQRGCSKNGRGMPAKDFSPPPVLFLVFNRPHLTEQVFMRIREARPAKLFIAADGPRPDRPEDQELCKAARAIVENVDWPCEVDRLYSEINLGCRKAVIAGITWMFEQVEEGIILEDDCLPDRSFFKFSADMLERFRNEPRIMHISGDCFLPRHELPGTSYYFSGYVFAWGWATWRRAWKLYDADMTEWPDLRDRGWMPAFIDCPKQKQWWTKRLNHAMEYELPLTWDYQWMFTCWVHQCLSVVPTVPLVFNIGFGPDATHTTGIQAKWSSLPARSLDYPLRHPEAITQCKKADRLAFRRVYLNETSFWMKCLTRLYRSISPRALFMRNFKRA